MDPAEPRARLLDVAESAFLEHGYGAANLGNIAAKAGMSKKTIYKFVSSKAELFAAVVANAIELENLSHHLQPATDGELRAPLRAYLLAHANLTLSPRGARADRLVMSEAIRFPELANAYLESGEAIALKPLITWLDEQRRAGHLSITSPDSAAKMLLAMTLSLPLRMLNYGMNEGFSDEEIVRFVDEALDVFLDGVRNRKGTGG